ncbi:DUF4296 domain-containing protein [Pedobacter insulae]|uniref:DUF4296 domain-containing protein n=1 Tax=Pedobacter insulae TaxID=414048 RepID=A0A1I3A9Q3_9SPHI|nr:DUF4296 domain-containing protein [Pedobacter insulae]SFH46843.1 protein of unknown function [Pedobacter insulae]
MKKIFAISIICSLIFACKPGVPDDIIQPDKMEKVLFDIHTVDGYIATLSVPDTAKIVAASYYKGIYKKFNIDSAKYNKSLDYYYSHPDVLTKLYENVMKELEDEQKRNEKRVENEELKKQQKYLAEHTKALDVSNLGVGRPVFSFSENPFGLSSTTPK